MRFTQPPPRLHPGGPGQGSNIGPHAFTPGPRALLALAALAACALVANAQSPAPVHPVRTAAQPQAPTATAPAAAGQSAAPSIAQEPVKPQATQLPASPAVPEDPHQQLTRQSEQLLKMANDLWNAVDKSTKDTLSVTVIRKADEIAQYAHEVRVKSTTEVGSR